MFFVVLFVFVVRQSTCRLVDVEYSEKLVSDHKGDLFGWSLATSHNKLVIGAPWDDNKRGSIMVDKVRVNGPEASFGYGTFVSVNQQFTIASGEYNESIYVHQSCSPYNIVATFPTYGNHVNSVVISDDNTVAVSYNDDNYNYWLTIYQYEGSTSWYVAEKFELENIGRSLAVYGDTVAVGVPRGSYPCGHVRTFNR